MENEMENEMGLSEQQVRWTMQHDWFVRTCRCQPSNNEQGFIIGVMVRHDTIDNEIKIFTDFKELRAWAGY